MATKHTANRAFDKDLRVSAYMVMTATDSSIRAVRVAQDASALVNSAAICDNTFAVVEEATQIEALLRQADDILQEVARLAAKIVRHEEAK